MDVFNLKTLHYASNPPSLTKHFCDNLDYEEDKNMAGVCIHWNPLPNQK